MTVPRVYFYCSDEAGNLQEDVVALAEGLSQLGVPFHSSCNYWLQSTTANDYLLKHDPSVSHEDCDVVVVSYTWPEWVRMRTFERRTWPLPRDLFKPGRRYATVYCDNNDGYRTIAWEEPYRQFDLILRSKFNRRAWHPLNMKPWAYGLTRRITAATAAPHEFRRRKHKLLVNFGASHPFSYSSRELARTLLEPRVRKVLPVDNTLDDLSTEPQDPYESLMWRQTGGRYSRSYYERLTQSQAVSCFCGDIIPSLPRRPDSYLVGGGRARVRRGWYQAVDLLTRRPERAVGCDSFRFWEALAAGCAVVNVDLDYYGVQMPVMPENGTHYLGVVFDRVDQLVDRLVGDPELLQRVAECGRRWANEHYSPRAAARRFLAMLCAGAHPMAGV
jgi:glycosyl transferase family 1